MQNTVSVIIPAFNSARYLGEALESVLKQTVQPAEIIVVDDGSIDDTALVCARYPAVLFVQQEHGGAARARNRGIEIAGGELISFLDADDLWHPRKLSLQIQCLESSPGLSAVFSYLDEFLSPELSFEHRKISLRKNVRGLAPSAMLARRRVFDQFGRFPEQWRMGEFIAWYQQALELGLAVAVLPEVLTLRRIHHSNTTGNKGAAANDYAFIVKDRLDRRRRRAQI